MYESLNVKKIKELYDFLEDLGDGMHGKLHIIDQSRFPEEKSELRIYHADGYCFDICKEQVEVAEDEINNSAIDGYEYSLTDGYEGFKELTILQYHHLLIK